MVFGNYFIRLFLKLSILVVALIRILKWNRVETVQACLLEKLLITAPI